MRPYNQQQVLDFVEGEHRARALMLPRYPAIGLQVVNTDGNRERDITCRGISSGQPYRVEEKYRTVDYGDFLIELFQDLDSQELGWYYKTKADLLAYVICSKVWVPQRAYIVRWKKFRQWWPTYLARKELHPRAVISPKGIGVSLNLAVNWRNVPTNLYVFRSWAES